MISLFHRKQRESSSSYDRGTMTPVIRCSICTGEQVAGFRHNSDGRFEEVMLIRDANDLAHFRTKYGITDEIEKFY